MSFGAGVGSGVDRARAILVPFVARAHHCLE